MPRNSKKCDILVVKVTYPNSHLKPCLLTFHCSTTTSSMGDNRTICEKINLKIVSQPT